MEHYSSVPGKKQLRYMVYITVDLLTLLTDIYLTMRIAVIIRMVMTTTMMMMMMMMMMMGMAMNCRIYSQINKPPTSQLYCKIWDILKPCIIINTGSRSHARNSNRGDG